MRVFEWGLMRVPKWAALPNAWKWGTRYFSECWPWNLLQDPNAPMALAYRCDKSEASSPTYQRLGGLSKSLVLFPPLSLPQAAKSEGELHSFFQPLLYTPLAAGRKEHHSFPIFPQMLHSRNFSLFFLMRKEFKHSSSLPFLEVEKKNKALHSLHLLPPWHKVTCIPPQLLTAFILSFRINKIIIISHTITGIM